jgi:hypothetical protein
MLAPSWRTRRLIVTTMLPKNGDRVAQSYPGFLHCIVRQSQCLMASPGQVLAPRHGQATRKATMGFTAPCGHYARGTHREETSSPVHHCLALGVPGPPFQVLVPKHGQATRKATMAFIAPTGSGAHQVLGPGYWLCHEGNATDGTNATRATPWRQRHKGTNTTSRATPQRQCHEGTSPRGPTWPPRPHRRPHLQSSSYRYSSGRKSLIQHCKFGVEIYQP